MKKDNGVEIYSGLRGKKQGGYHDTLPELLFVSIKLFCYVLLAVYCGAMIRWSLVLHLPEQG